ncbi:helix-turn-helix domain-containing protein [Neisseria sp. N95_16]|uniref:Helix-turn-helix domain-containing protein n=1 Tax=Neisseria brasiliensis TaxID=2666100 RepID=A0A5Q3S7Y7_9NEIS|nr:MULTISPECIES: helix-turn-helix domain-containing protein [Neisseria]MRN38969.1 helix-turn-helix domain-containing protein [Neisseria brasiliensis]MRN39168.1 helix-turn-helix domain-containing protein [Neisseria brasiliensis]PJO08782.1 helix-turn-helix domain-containing protein [Neisseria sp. N95_16]PJO78465.1 helix-turn-helix domain-containing protein [Neisseria sp. N177_16]QGL26056.1 helix-turn-helix domain-containing protein [Neisseria brasiliensis]
MENISLFGSRLKVERKKLGLTQSQLAEKCGITREMWGKYERGVFMPNCEIIFSFYGLGADVNFLFTGNRPSENSNELSKDELELLQNYRQSTDKSREIILTIAKTQEKKEVGITAGEVA